jgi:hypothetical protein
MSRISKTGFKPKQSYKLFCDYVYNENVKIPEVEPHCNCAGAYEMNGCNVTQVVKGDSGHLKVTKEKDGICQFCGHYVMYRPEQLTGRGHYKRKKQ